MAENLDKRIQACEHRFFAYYTFSGKTHEDCYHFVRCDECKKSHLVPVSSGNITEISVTPGALVRKLYFGDSYAWQADKNGMVSIDVPFIAQKTYDEMCNKFKFLK